MKKKIKIIELFSGIGGFIKGFEDAGYTIEEHYYSEIDKHAIANYKYNYPNAEYIGSVVDINGENYSNCNILTFGFPCQDLSLAGKRLGFKGKRSSLFYHAARILREGQIETFIWENVMGLLSSNKGADIQSVCEELYLSGYVFDFEEQNTKWYLPQNRRRIYCIGHNIKKMHKWIISEQNGQNQKYFLYRKIIKSWVLNKYQKYLTEVLNQSEQRQKELVLEFYFQKEQKMLNGVNLKKRLSEIINSLPFENWKYCYQTVLELLLKQCDINSDALIVQNLNSLQEVINTCGTKEEMEKRKSFLSIEKLLKMLLEENLKAVNKSIILTLINSTTKLKTFTYAKMQLNIELFIIQLSLLYPYCWKEELSDLIERQRNTNYAKIRENEIRNFKKNNNAPVQLSIFEEIGDDTIGHLADRSEPGVFPIGENDEWINERAIESRSIRTLTAGGNSGGLHSSMTLVKTLQGSETLNTIRSGGRGSLTDKHSLDIVQIGAFRGRNQENPKSRESGLPTEQMLEINKEGVSNTLTSVQKDNVVICTWRTHKYGNGFREIKENISPTIPARAREDGSGQPVINIKNNNNGKNKERNSINFLSELQQEIGEKKITEWGFRILNSLQEEKILQQTMYVGSIHKEGEKEESIVDDSTLSCKKAQERLLREMWDEGEFGCSSHKWGLARQFFREFTDTLQKLPYKSTQESEKLFGMQWKLLRKRLLRETLSKMEETWESANDKNQSIYPSSIRRLTPIECEILQGFPPNWTEYGNYDGNIKKTPKTQRYKMLGNAVTVKVVEEIAKRLNLE